MKKPLKQPLAIGSIDWQKFMLNSPVLTSYQSSWSSILLDHYRLPLMDLPEVSNLQHVVVIPLGHQAVDFEFVAQGRSNSRIRLKNSHPYRDERRSNPIRVHLLHLLISAVKKFRLFRTYTNSQKSCNSSCQVSEIIVMSYVFEMWIKIGESFVKTNS